MNPKQVFTIKTLAKELELSEIYVRKAVRDGSLKTTLVPIAEGAKTSRHEILGADAIEWRKGTQSRSRRDDNRNKGVFYATQDEYKAIKAAITKALPEYDVASLLTLAKEKKAG